QVNKAWAGLGYYRRAKMLHEGARKVQADHRGSVPSTAKALKELPGIGPYTAGAVASIAFGECEPLVDGNVIRVLSRLKAIASDPKSAALNKLCWDLARSIVDPDRPGDFNQALMELGATVCTVSNPSCYTCPAKTICLAHNLTARSQHKPSTTTDTIVKSSHHNTSGEGTTTTADHVKKGAKSTPLPKSLPLPKPLPVPTSTSGEPGVPPGQACACTVCEVGEDGMAVVPLTVTEFPRKALKT
ncbi:unnamed protein product, partial [Laminaria digitata]